MRDQRGPRALKSHEIAFGQHPQALARVDIPNPGNDAHRHQCEDNERDNQLRLDAQGADVWHIDFEPARVRRLRPDIVGAM